MFSAENGSQPNVPLLALLQKSMQHPVLPWGQTSYVLCCCLLAVAATLHATSCSQCSSLLHMYRQHLLWPCKLCAIIAPSEARAVTTGNGATVSSALTTVREPTSKVHMICQLAGCSGFKV